MRAEDTLQYIFDFFPEYPSRKAVLYMLFCMVGNGFYWQDGELVTHDDRADRYKLNKKVMYAKPGSLNKMLHEDHCRKLELMRRRFIRSGKSEIETDRIINDMKNHKLTEKPPKLSNIYNYPKNIKQDWLRLLKETKQYLQEDGYEIR